MLLVATGPDATRVLPVGPSAAVLQVMATGAQGGPPWLSVVWAWSPNPPLMEYQGQQGRALWDFRAGGTTQELLARVRAPVAAKREDLQPVARAIMEPGFLDGGLAKGEQAANLFRNDPRASNGALDETLAAVKQVAHAYYAVLGWLTGEQDALDIVAGDYRVRGVR